MKTWGNAVLCRRLMYLLGLRADSCQKDVYTKVSMTGFLKSNHSSITQRQAVTEAEQCQFCGLEHFGGAEQLDKTQTSRSQFGQSVPCLTLTTCTEDCIIEGCINFSLPLILSLYMNYICTDHDYKHNFGKTKYIYSLSR